MSINDFINKIKDKLYIDTFTILCLFIIIGVGISAFGLGRLSVFHESSFKKQSIILEKDNQLGSIEKIDLNISNENIEEKRYVASKNSKLYYPIECSGAKRILSENQIWFASSFEAEETGYQLASSCK